MKKIFLVLLLCTGFVTYGQLNLDPDTVLYEQKTGGAIDTFDIANGDLPTTFENGRSIMSERGLSSGNLFQDITSRKMQRFTSYDPLKFSAIPHLGFAYSFGGQGTQFVRLDYSQAFSEQLLFNLKYDRNTGAGYIQNSNFTENNVRMQLQRNAQRYSLQLKASFQSFDAAHSGGVVGDSASLASIETFGLEFSAVNKSSAASVTKLGSVVLKNYFNFSPDSLNHIGVTTQHHYSISNRVYLESGDLSSIYDSIYIDTIDTRDQFNWARIRNAGGVYYSNQKNAFYLDGLIEHGYWQFQNLGNYYDTTEIGLVTNARIKIRQLVLSNKARVNFIGAFNEWKEEARLKFDRDRFKVNASFVLENSAPDPFLRRYNANNFQYDLSSISKQVLMRLGGGVDWNLKDSVFRLRAKGDFSTISSVYQYSGTEWEQTNTNFVFSSITAKANINLGNFGIYPTVVYSIDNQGYLPDLQAYARIFVKGKLFKAKRLEAVVGVDASYITSYNTRVYVPALDLMDFNSVGSNSSNMFNLHAFVSFGIQEFRFFLRYENIGYFWNDTTSDEQFNYPISGTRMRIGLSWDFFN